MPTPSNLTTKTVGKGQAPAMKRGRRNAAKAQANADAVAELEQDQQPEPQAKAPHPIPVTVPKRQRTRLAKAELLMALATTAERWAGEVAGSAPGGLPFAEWPENDAMRRLCITYALAPADLVRILRGIGAEIENSALRRGYEEAWR